MRRFVRVTDDLFELLETLLPAERDEDGAPSIGDFVNTGQGQLAPDSWRRTAGSN